MKTAPLFLAGSFAANLALFGVVAWQPALAPPAFRDFFTRHFHTAEAAGDVAPNAAAPAPVEKTKIWNAISTDDLATLVARLRAMGFPPEIIRSLVQAQINARYNARIQALREPDPNTPFWKLPSSFTMFGATSKSREEAMQLERERAKLVRELLADDFFATNDVTADQRRRFGNLPRNKIDALQRIEDDYSEMMSGIRATMKGITLSEDREKFALLEREKHADLAAILSPEELADYEVRSSPITSMLRSSLNGFVASEEEFRAIFQMQQAYGEKFPFTSGFGGSDYQQRRAVLEQLNSQLKVALGDARYADYLRETSYDYGQLKRLTQRENLPIETAQLAFGVKEKTAEESNRIFDDSALTNDQKLAALKTLAQEARTQLVSTLGPVAGPAYVKFADNQWLSMVERGSAVKFTDVSMSMSNGNATIVFGGGGNFRQVPRPAPPPRP